MIPSIVVLTDFFAVPNRALTYAAGLAVPLEASLVLLHARHNELLAPTEFASRHTAAGQKQTLYALEELAADQPVATAVDVSNLSLIEAVQEIVGQRPPLMIVLGRSRAEPSPDDLVTETAMDLLRHTPYPLLVVPTAGWDAFPPRRLLLAVDGKPFRLVGYHDVLNQLLGATQGTLSLVQVTHNAETPPSASAVLDSVFTNGLVPELPEASLRQVYQNTVVGGILQEAAGRKADMLVVIARRHSLLGSLFHNSVTAQLLRESAIPVLVLPAAD